MAEKKIFTVTDLGGGDGGKGGVVHALCTLKKAHTVLKVGGAQGSHGVHTSQGESFNFSQFGCGTFGGTRTHITDRMVMEPYRLLEEGRQLKYEWGIGNIFDYMTIDENALCATPYHTIASRLRELARKDNPKGTIGIGIGEAVRDSETHPELAIYAKDIGKPYLKDKIAAVRAQKIKDLSSITENVSGLWLGDQLTARKQIELLNEVDFIDRIVDTFNEVSALVRIVGKEYLQKEILQKEGVIVVESSHGVLTDKYYGFHPHTTALRTLPTGTLELLDECGYDGEIRKLGVTRAYQIRHGAGPMVTASPEFVSKLLPHSNKDENRWQGKVRVGPLDFVALKYAIDVCGGPKFFDGLAVTWFDQIQTLGQWSICDSYIGATDENFFSPAGAIKVHSGIGLQQLEHQQQLGKLLNACRPNITSYDLTAGANQQEVAELCKQVFESRLHVPVKMISFGSTEGDKVCI